RDESRGEQVVQHVDIGRDARHQAAYRVAVVERQIEALQVLHQLPSQVEHGELSGVLHQVHLGEFGDQGAELEAEVQQADRAKSAPRLRRQQRIEKRGGARGVRLKILING